MQIDVNLTIRADGALSELIRAALAWLQAAPQAAATPAAALAEEPAAKAAAPKPENEEPKAAPQAARDIIDAACRRLMGANYQEEASQEPVKSLYPQAVQQFRRAARTISGGRTDKPTQLLPQELERFAAECECLEAEGGKIIVSLPF